MVCVAPEVEFEKKQEETGKTCTCGHGTRFFRTWVFSGVRDTSRGCHVQEKEQGVMRLGPVTNKWRDTRLCEVFVCVTQAGKKLTRTSHDRILWFCSRNPRNAKKIKVFFFTYTNSTDCPGFFLNKYHLYGRTRMVGNAIDRGIDLSITVDKLRVFINKTLSDDHYWVLIWNERTRWKVEGDRNPHSRWFHHDEINRTLQIS